MIEGIRMYWDHEPAQFLGGADVRRLTYISEGNQNLLTSAPTRFMESLHLLSHTHGDHELVRPRSRRPPRPRKRPDRVGCRGRERGGGRVARFMEKAMVSDRKTPVPAIRRGERA